MKRILFLLMLATVIITGCSEKENVEDTIHEDLTEAVLAEEGVDELQKEINEHSSKERKLYDDIIALPLDDQEQLEKLIVEAKEELQQIELKIQEIQSKLGNSESIITELNAYTKELDSEAKQVALEKVEDKLLERLEKLSTYYDTYTKSLQTSMKLYDLFLTEGFQTNNVYATIEEVNDLYDELMEINEEINEKTNEVNEAKTTFYDLINNPS